MEPCRAIFDRRLYAQRRARSAARFGDHDFLHRRAMEDIVDRLESVNREFPKALFYGAGALTSMLTARCAVGEIVHADLARQRLGHPANGAGVVFDEEAAPFAPGSFNLIVSLLTLHHANDLVGALAQMRDILKPDGLLIVALFGEQTLSAFKNAFLAAESALSGGVYSRFSPLGAIRDLGACLQRAGLALPVADMDSVEVNYSDPLNLIGDLRGMGETSVLIDRANPPTRAVAAQALSEFARQGAKAGFDIIFLTGWAPHESQQKPLKPGSAKASLEEALKSRLIDDA